jgi:plasmid stabilization system protein ParE
MTGVVRFTALAQAHLELIDSWWRSHREAAPDLFTEELAEALELLSRHPRAGIRYKSRKVSGVRRFPLRTTRYHVYFKTEGDDLVVLAVWSSVRGRGPDLKTAG